MDKKKIKRAFRLELSLIALFSADMTLLAYWTTVKPESQTVRLWLGVAAMVITVLFVLVLRALIKLNLKSVVVMRLKMLAAKISGYFITVLERWGILKTNPDMLQGRTVSEFDFSPLYRNSARRHKPPRWSKSKTAREKLGYLYYKLITHKIKDGMSAFASDTPLELRLRSENDELEERVFDSYITARYAERADVSEKEMIDLKEKMFRFEK